MRETAPSGRTAGVAAGASRVENAQLAASKPAAARFVATMDDHGATPASSPAVEPGDLFALDDLILEGDRAGIEELLAARPALLHARSFDFQETWLHYAAGEGKRDLVRFFFERGIPLNTTNISGESPLSDAVDLGDRELVRWMLDNGADPLLNHEPMVSAVSGGHLDLVRLFVELGAEYDFVFGSPPRTPLSQALDFGHQEVAEYLRSLNAALPAPAGESRNEPFDLHTEIKEYFEYHLERAPEPLGLQEIVPGQVSLSVWAIDPKNRKDPKVLFTSGMSERPLQVPEGCEEYQYAELVMYLPPDWPSPPDLQDTAQCWPWLWLRTIAHSTHEQQTWLGDWTTTFANGDPPAPLDPSTNFAGFVLATNMAPLEGFRSDDGRFVNIVMVIPAYAEELALAQRENGTVELMRRFQKRGIGASLKPGRPNVALETGLFRGLFHRGTG
jgi:hypothetical protein